MKTYLALGDSYTIGEQVQLAESFPYQAVQLLRKIPQGDSNAGGSFLNLEITAPEIIAKTGWTTDELMAAISKTTFLPQYNFVSLLIGVNNQYRGRSVQDFEIEFAQLLQLAVLFSGSKNKQVFVLSIPDWGVTPFAEGRDRQQISKEIDAYNTVCRLTAEKNQCQYIDITTSQREDAAKPDFMAADTLHPSAKEYAKWAGKLSDRIRISAA